MKLNNKGFSLIELMLAVVVSTIVFGAITALITFSSRSMRDTNARVDVQNQAKDALNHMESYAMESTRAYWDDTEKILILFGAPSSSSSSVVPGATPEPSQSQMADSMIQGLMDGTKTYADVATMKCDSYVYWFDDNGVYFAKASERTVTATPAPGATPVPYGTSAPGPTISVVDLTRLSALTDAQLRNYLLADNVDEFACSILKNEQSNKTEVDINMKFEDDVAPDYSCGKRVYLRNQ